MWYLRRPFKIFRSKRWAISIFVHSSSSILIIRHSSNFLLFARGHQEDLELENEEVRNISYWLVCRFILHHCIFLTHCLFYLVCFQTDRSCNSSKKVAIKQWIIRRSYSRSTDRVRGPYHRARARESAGRSVNPAHVCFSKVTDGELCNEDEDCNSGRCDASSHLSLTLICWAKLGNGEYCNESSDCLSEDCDYRFWSSVLLTCIGNTYVGSNAVANLKASS